MPNIAAHLFQRAIDSPSKTALIFGDRHFTFSQLHERVCSLAASLRQAGFARGDKLGLMLATSPEFIFFEHAAFALGVVVVPINVHYMSGEIEHALGACDVDFLLIQDVLADRVSEAMLARLPRLRKIFALGRYDFELEASPITQVTDLEPGELALMLHTSATTGKAKGVMLTVANLQANYDRTPAWLGLTADDRILCALPLYNTFGLNQCINAMMVTSATLVLLPRFDVHECLSALQTHRCTFLPAVPTMLSKMLNDSRIDDFDLTSMRRILVGAAPVPRPLLEQVYRVMGRQTVVMTGYGLTEATALVSLEHTALDGGGNLRRPKSVGRALPGIQMMVADETGVELPPQTIGQICIKGPNIMKGYYNQDAETAKAVIDGWLQTGDLAVMDAERHFYIVDRKKDLIIRGGQNIYPADIEEVLYSHPAVAEAAVIAAPDAYFGEVPEGYVALKPGASVSAEELMALCKLQLAYFKVPKQIHFLAELPKGPTGKILRRGLRSDAAYVPVKSSQVANHRVRGLKYAIRTWGSPDAPVLFMLHGLRDGSGSFQFLVDALQLRWHVIAPDWRGHGGSEPGSHQAWFHDYVADLDAIVEIFQPRQTATLIGHSLGGNVASVYAGLRPERVANLISIDAFGFLPTSPKELAVLFSDWLQPGRGAATPKVYASVAAMAIRLREANVRLPADRALFLAQTLSTPVPGGLRWQFAGIDRRSVPTLHSLGEWVACWRGITARTLWIAAADPRKNTVLSDTASFDFVIDTIGRESVIHLPDTGHNIHHDAPLALARSIENFLTEGAP